MPFHSWWRRRESNPPPLTVSCCKQRRIEATPGGGSVAAATVALATQALEPVCGCGSRVGSMFRLEINFEQLDL